MEKNRDGNAWMGRNRDIAKNPSCWQVSDGTWIVVISSSFQSDEDVSYAAGANGYLHKDLDFERFSRDLKPLLHRWFAG